MQKLLENILKSKVKSFAYIPEPKGQAKPANDGFVGVLRSPYKFFDLVSPHMLPYFSYKLPKNRKRVFLVEY